MYDLTTFSSDHPGGIDALEGSAGTDGTEAYEYAGHSEDNMAKMQQYCVGKLAGGVRHQQAIATTSQQTTLFRMDKSIKGAASDLRKLNTAGNKLAVTVIATSSLVVALSRLYLPSLPEDLPALLTTTSSSRLGYAFGAGTVVVSVVSLVVFRYLYLLFLSSLVYQNDVFSFPATIPRKTRR